MTSIKRMEVDVFTMLTVVVLAGQPFLPVSIPQTTYTPICGASPRAGGSGATVSGGATGTTYDTAFSATSFGGQTATVPIWWTAVMRLSAGVTNAALLSIPCAVDLREVKFELDNQRVADPGTLRQIPLFITDCWAPSRALFDRRNDTLPAGTDPDDINWAGSQTFQSAGYYDRRQAKREIPGFPFRATITGNTATGRDSAYYNPNLPPPQWGHPLCSEWWSDSQNGIRGLGCRAFTLCPHAVRYEKGGA